MTITINNTEYHTYATIDEADKYLNVKYDSNWSTFDDDKKALLLINAAREIDKQKWQGVKVDKEQELQFPRKIGCKVTDDELVKQACIELADGLAATNGAVGSTANLQAIKSMKVGDTDITFKDDAILEDAVTVALGVINALLKDYLKGNAEVWL